MKRSVLLLSLICCTFILKGISVNQALNNLQQSLRTLAHNLITQTNPVVEEGKKIEISSTHTSSESPTSFSPIQALDKIKSIRITAQAPHAFTYVNNFIKSAKVEERNKARVRSPEDLPLFEITNINPNYTTQKALENILEEFYKVINKPVLALIPLQRPAYLSVSINLKKERLRSSNPPISILADALKEALSGATVTELISEFPLFDYDHHQSKEMELMNDLAKAIKEDTPQNVLEPTTLKATLSYTRPRVDPITFTIFKNNTWEITQ